MPDLDKCPVCGGKLDEHVPETDNDHEYWSFECYAMIYCHDGKLFVDNNCEDITQIVIDKLNKASSESVSVTSPDRPADVSVTRPDRNSKTG